MVRNCNIMVRNGQCMVRNGNSLVRTGNLIYGTKWLWYAMTVYRIERSMKKCQLCNHQDSEDKYHILLIVQRILTSGKSVCKFACHMGSSDTLALAKLE